MGPEKGRQEIASKQPKPKAGEGEYFDIRLTIDGKTFPMRVRRKDEELYRKAEKEINNLVVDFRKRFRNFQPEDHLAMAAIVVAVSKAETERQRTLGEEIEKLIQVDELLEEYISGVE